MIVELFLQRVILKRRFCNDFSVVKSISVTTSVQRVIFSITSLLELLYYTYCTPTLIRLEGNHAWGQVLTPADFAPGGENIGVHGCPLSRGSRRSDHTCPARVIARVLFFLPSALLTSHRYLPYSSLRASQPSFSARSSFPRHVMLLPLHQSSGRCHWAGPPIICLTLSPPL